jgi:hypothetical protein
MSKERRSRDESGRDIYRRLRTAPIFKPCIHNFRLYLRTFSGRAQVRRSWVANGSTLRGGPRQEFLRSALILTGLRLTHQIRVGAGSGTQEVAGLIHVPDHPGPLHSTYLLRGAIRIGSGRDLTIPFRT